jgi:hypothetical protein
VQSSRQDNAPHTRLSNQQLLTGCSCTHMTVNKREV